MEGGWRKKKNRSRNRSVAAKLENFENEAILVEREKDDQTCISFGTDRKSSF